MENIPETSEPLDLLYLYQENTNESFVSMSMFYQLLHPIRRTNGNNIIENTIKFLDSILLFICQVLCQTIPLVSITEMYHAILSSLEAEVLENSLSVNKLLSAESCNSEHSKTSVAKLLGLYKCKLLGIGGLQTKRIETNITGVI